MSTLINESAAPQKVTLLGPAQGRNYRDVFTPRCIIFLIASLGRVLPVNWFLMPGCGPRGAAPTPGGPARPIFAAPTIMKLVGGKKRLIRRNCTTESLAKYGSVGLSKTTVIK
ncbi:hypothetical protein MTP99_009740 [Tenebrio molitor]|nr:hypothetical protein MTP99_009740 [Tenebrio molitor]